MTNPYLEGNFAPVLEERTDRHDLPVTGAVPPDLEGRLLRIGPNPAAVIDDPSTYHWFTGDGMVHAVALSGGRAVGYRNRWVRTRRLAATLGTVGPKGPVEPIDGPANTHVIRHAGTTLALVESGLPHALSADLARARVHDFDGMLASPMCAHPKVDPDRGELVFFGIDPFGPPYLRTHVVDADGILVAGAEVALPRAVFMHDAGLTATRMVLLDLPVVLDPTLAATGRPIPFRWTPEAGARVGLLPRGDDGTAVRWIDVDPGYVFHVMNAYDDGEAVVLDVVRYDAAFDTGPGGALSGSLPSLHRWTVDPSASRVHEVRLDDTPVEFPRIDEARTGRPHRYGYCTVLGNRPEAPSFGGLVKYDLVRDVAVRYDPGGHRAASEPVFVRAADGHGEDEGWVLTVVYDPERGASDLVVLDATSFRGPPVATVHLPARVPFGFHGSWVPTDS